MKSIKIALFGLFVGLAFASCDSFLDVENYSGVPGDDFITSAENAQYAVNGVYSTLWDEMMYYYGYYFYTDLSSGELEPKKTDAEMRPFAEFYYYDSFTQFQRLWKGLYVTIQRANDTSTKIYRLLDGGTIVDETEKEELRQMIGECTFLRGFAYFFLVRSFGDKLPSHPEYDPNGLGVAIQDTLVLTRDQVKKPRATLKECWDEVIRDFKIAYNLLPDAWPDAKLGAVRKGAAAAYLGHVYMYMKDYDAAKEWFEKVLEDDRYALVEDYAWNFDPYHENNSEAIFEVQAQSTLDYTTRTSYLWRRLAPDNVAGGFGMVGVPNEWASKFSNGVLFTQEAYDGLLASINWDTPANIRDVALYQILLKYEPFIDQQTESLDEFFNLPDIDWAALGEEINTILRENRIRGDVTTEGGWGTVDCTYVQEIINTGLLPEDPRKYTSFYCPGRDSIASDWAATKVSAYPNSYYGFKKYIPYNAPSTWTSEGLPYGDGFNSINQRVFRLADLYLQYAEACYRTGDTDNAAKYLNKVRRRAWGEAFDDASLTTKGEHDYPMAGEESKDFITEVLVPERELELSLEGLLWFDYLRLNLLFEDSEFSQAYKDRGFDPAKHHRLPIPLTERQIVGLDVLIQNSGY